MNGSKKGYPTDQLLLYYSTLRYYSSLHSPTVVYTSSRELSVSSVTVLRSEWVLGALINQSDLLLELTRTRLKSTALRPYLTQTRFWISASRAGTLQRPEPCCRGRPSSTHTDNKTTLPTLLPALVNMPLLPW